MHERLIMRPSGRGRNVLTLGPFNYARTEVSNRSSGTRSQKGLREHELRPMSHQGFEGWFPECLVCGCGNVGPVVCLDPTCHEHHGLRSIIATDEHSVTRDGHHWKLCQLCERQCLSDPGAWGSFALCIECWNKFAQAEVFPPHSPSLLVAAVERGVVVLRPEVRVRKVEK